MHEPTTQDDRRRYLIGRLAEERGERYELPDDVAGQRALLRALMNVRPPEPAAPELLRVQDAYLRERAREKGVHRVEEATPSPADPWLSIWQGDITTIAADAVVNAANSQMLGCFVPNHGCIDNAIHTFAGIELRLECARHMAGRGWREVAAGGALSTSAYNLPARHVIHTVGPIVAGPAPTARDVATLRSCYRSCLDEAARLGCGSVAFCCVSTGVFRYPNEPAARTAIDEVRLWHQQTGSGMRVVMNVFKDLDRDIYAGLLGIGA